MLAATRTDIAVHAHRRRAIPLHKVSRILKGGEKKGFFAGWLWQRTTGESERGRRGERETERSRRQMVALNRDLPKTTHTDLTD